MTAILEHEVRSTFESSVTGLHRHLFTRDEYYTMADAGLFRDKRVELIEGEIIEMAPIGDPHAAVTEPTYDILREAFGAGFSIRNQAPIAIGPDYKPSDPQPDVAVVVGTWRDYLSHKPGPDDIKLIVEVSDSSLKDDRTIKATLYASAGIVEYWIVNLVDSQLEVHRQPTETGYASVTIYRTTETVEPLFAPGKSVLVGNFIP